jgi:hypothetical protein
MAKTHFLGKLTVNRDASGRVIQDWIRVRPDDAAREAAIPEAIAAFSTELPRAQPVNMQRIGSEDLANQYTITDHHFGLLSWDEETGANYDGKIAEKLWANWFAAAIRQSPDAYMGILAPARGAPALRLAFRNHADQPPRARRRLAICQDCPRGHSLHAARGADAAGKA